MDDELYSLDGMFSIGDTIIHVNHGRGVVMHIWPDTDMTVHFDNDIPPHGNIVIVMAQYCRKDTDHAVLE
jgi:hypothetical protein